MKKKGHVYHQDNRSLGGYSMKFSLDYKTYVTRGNIGINLLLLRCQNAVYGTMVASLIYYRKFTKSLIIIGFYISPYDLWISNKVIDGSQMTICFHVYDFNRSYREHKANYFIIDWLRQEYERIFEDGSGKMSVIQGKVMSTLEWTYIALFVVKWGSRCWFTLRRSLPPLKSRIQNGRARSQAPLPTIFMC